MKEYKIGERITVTLEVQEATSYRRCIKCAFGGFNGKSFCKKIACLGSERSDGKDVIFKEVRNGKE